MKEILGKQIYDSLREIVNPGHAAVLVVDMQNDFCKVGGHLDAHGRKGDVVKAEKMVPTLARFLDKARAEGLFIVYIVNSYLPGGLIESPAWLYQLWKRGLRREGDDVPYTVEGTWGQEIVPELRPRSGEPVVRKHRSSAFHNTCLDLVLRNRGIESVIVTGTATRNCCEKTAIDGAMHDYYVVMLKDCLAPPDDTLATIGYYDVATSEDVLKEWAILRKSGS